MDSNGIHFKVRDQSTAGYLRGGRSVPCALNCKPRTSFAHALLVSYGTPIAMLQQTTAVYIRRLLALIIIASPIL